MSQNDKIFKHLLCGLPISQPDAYRFYKCWRLADIIKDIKAALNNYAIYQDWEIVTHKIKRGSANITSYELVIK